MLWLAPWLDCDGFATSETSSGGWGGIRGSPEGVVGVIFLSFGCVVAALVMAGKS